jgi:hypothetical protein
MACRSGWKSCIISARPATKRKRWKVTGGMVVSSIRDTLVKVAVDVPDTPKHRHWMKRFKVRWKSRPEQLDLWMVSYRIEVE